jgi:hypothetical protein
MKSTQSNFPHSKSPNVLKEKPPTKNSKAKPKKESENSSKRVKSEDVETTTSEVKKVRISEEETHEEPLSSPPSSPIKSGKRRRVQIFESDESGSDTENIITSPTNKPSSPCTPSPSAPAPIPKRKTAKLSKEFRSKLKNRVQTPHVSKLRVEIPKEVSSPEEMETSPPPAVTRPSPVLSKLSSFAYKKRAVSSETSTSADKSDSNRVEDKTVTEKLNVDLKETMSPVSSKKSSVADSAEKSPTVKKETKVNLKSSPVSKVKTPESKPKGKEKAAPKGVSLVSANSGDGYNPGKSGYVPSSDAIWNSGVNVPYKALSDTLKVC